MRSWAQEVPKMLALMADMVMSNGFDDDTDKILGHLV